MAKRVGWVIVVVVMLLATVALQAQVSTSSITGVVRDASGAVIPGANVEVKNEAILNHTNFPSPLAASTGSPSIVSTTFGQSCCVAISLPSSANVASGGEPNRVIQFGLKLSF